MKIHKYFVYIMTNPARTVFYIGVTNALQIRVGQHCAAADALSNTFCGRYNCRHLVYTEEYQWVQQAIGREKQVKKFSRAKKLALIREQNPGLDFLELHE